MLKIDTTNIKEMTKQKIAYDYYEREENMRKNKLRKLAIVAFVFSFFIGGTITVNALADNKIAETVKETVKDALRVKVNDKDYNAKCQKNEKGYITCKIPAEAIGKEAESSITVDEDYLDKIETELKVSEDGETEMDITINK